MKVLEGGQGPFHIRRSERLREVIRVSVKL